MLSGHTDIGHAPHAQVRVRAIDVERMLYFSWAAIVPFFDGVPDVSESDVGALHDALAPERRRTQHRSAVSAGARERRVGAAGRRPEPASQFTTHRFAFGRAAPPMRRECGAFRATT